MRSGRVENSHIMMLEELICIKFNKLQEELTFFSDIHAENAEEEVLQESHFFF